MPTPTVRALATAVRSYQRPVEPNDPESLLETWDQVCDRVVGHQRWLWTRALERIGEEFTDKHEAELTEMRVLLVNHKAMLAGRTMWLGGTEIAKTRESSQFNCSFVEVATIYDVVDTLWLLLQGCGVGFKPVVGQLSGFRKALTDIQVIRSTRTEKGDPNNYEHFDKATKTWTIRVGDSAEAWARAAGKLVAGKYPAVNLVLDFSEIRPAGYRLKGYGWISSGDRQIHRAFEAIARILSRRADQLLSAIDILDICNHLGTILSSRRSAQIALLDAEDPEVDAFVAAKRDYWKNGNDHRRQSNNSIVYESRPELEVIETQLRQMYEAGGSEPGLINAETAKKRAPWFRGMNPSLRRGTRVLTTHGIFPIEELESQDFLVRNLDGQWSPAHCRLSGQNKPLYEITFSGGQRVWATAEHDWPIHVNGRFVKVPTTDLRAGDALPLLRQTELFNGEVGTYDDGFLVGWIIGDGWVTERKSGEQQIGMIVGDTDRDAGIADILIRILRERGCQATFHPSSGGAKSAELNTINKNLSELLQTAGYRSKDQLPDLVWANGSEEFRKGLVDGLFSSDGCVAAAGPDGRVRLGSSRESLLRDVADLLGFYGLRTSVRSQTTKAKFPNGSSGNYTQWALSIAGTKNVAHFAATFHLSHTEKQQKLNEVVSRKRWRVRDDDLIRVKAVKETDIREDVWDIGVADKTHCFQIAPCVTGNCAEILLGNKSFCNLVEINLLAFRENRPDLIRALHIMARANYRQTLVDLRDGVLQEAWHTSNDFLHLCGVGLTGIAACPDLSEYDYKYFSNVAKSAAVQMAQELDQPLPKNVTTVKPSGTASKVMSTLEWGEVPEGIHRPMGKYIFNWITYSTDDPIVTVLQDANYEVMEKPNEPESVLVKFPVCYDTVPFERKRIRRKRLDPQTNSVVEIEEDVEVNMESAVDQLKRYRMLLRHWCDHNASVTVYYDPEELPAIAAWLHTHWDDYVAVSFLLRMDPTKTAEDLGHPYLPQEVVTESDWAAYTATLQDVDWSRVVYREPVAEDCATGACPIV